ncbi:hypothetical protein ACWGJB_20625 [Streptomyces sp. NPDC054813]
MRGHLAGRPGAVAAAVAEDRAALERFGARHGHPFIVKPVDG